MRHVFFSLCRINRYVILPLDQNLTGADKTGRIRNEKSHCDCLGTRLDPDVRSLQDAAVERIGDKKEQRLNRRGSIWIARSQYEATE